MNCTNKSYTAIIKTVGNKCNLRCKYCFHRKEDQKANTLMSIELLEQLIAQYLDINQSRHTFIWHGGEPTLAGIDFFIKVIEYQNKYKKPNQMIRNSIQTNGTLITKDWAKFFKENKFAVGVSLDGCDTSHDKYRLFSNGAGSHKRVIRGIEILREHEIRLGFIQTIASDRLKDLQKDFNFFTQELDAKSWGVNYFIDYGESMSSGLSVTSDAMASHMIKCINLWLKRDDSDLQIREIDCYFRPFLGKKTGNCSFTGTCGSYFCLDWDGRITPCDRLSNFEMYVVGNLTKQTLAEILEGTKMMEFCRKASTLPEDCKVCRWLDYCYNGCAEQRVGGVSGKYYHCEARKSIFEYTETLALKYGVTAVTKSV